MDRLLQTIELSTVSTILWYIILSAIGVVVAPYPAPSGFFTIFQVITLVGDIGDAEKSNRLLSNFVAAFLNGLIGWAVGDTIAYVGGIVVGIIIFLKAFDRL